MRPKPAALHLRQHGARGVEGGREIDRQDGIPFLRRELLHRRDVLDAGVVHQDVHRTEAAADALTMSRIAAGSDMSASS